MVNIPCLRETRQTNIPSHDREHADSIVVEIFCLKTWPPTIDARSPSNEQFWEQRITVRPKSPQVKTPVMRSKPNSLLYQSMLTIDIDMKCPGVKILPSLRKVNKDDLRFWARQRKFLMQLQTLEGSRGLYYSLSAHYKVHFECNYTLTHSALPCRRTAK